MAESTAGQIIVRCSCGAKLKVNAATVGKKARCPKCKEVFTIEAPAESSTPDPGPSDLLAQLAQSESSAATVAAGPQAPRYVQCPGCRVMMPSVASVCTSCGYNRDTGRVMKGAPQTQHSKGLVSRMSKAGGAWALGCAFGALGVLVGGAVWVTIAVVTGLELGLIAWGLGALAGFGMSLGYKEPSAMAGVVAAGIAAVGIVIARIFVFAFVIYTVVTGTSSDMSMIRAHVQLAMTDEILDEKGLVSPTERREAGAAAYFEARNRVSRMSDEQVRKRRDEIREEAERRLAAMDPTGSKAVRLATHRAERRADLAGLTFGDPARRNFYREELAKCKQLSAGELAAATTELDAWEKEGRWADAAYVRSQLMHTVAREIIRKHPEYAPAGGDRAAEQYQWNRLYNQAAETVDALTPPQQLERLKGEQQAALLAEQRERLAWHRAELEALRKGLAYDDPQRDELYDAAAQAAEAMTPADLDAAIKKLDAWEEGGSDHDAEYVRNQLIYREIGIAQEEATSDNPQNRPTLRPMPPSPEEWKALYDGAVAKVDGLSPAERLDRLHQLDARRAQRAQDEALQQETEELKEASVGMFKTLFSLMFQPLSLLFFALAMVSAFKLGSVGRS